jgi:hypothetical protein
MVKTGSLVVCNKRLNMMYFEVKYLDVKLYYMTRVQPSPLSPSLPVPPDTSGVHIWLILMKAHRALAHHAEQSIVGLGFCFSDFATLEPLFHKGYGNRAPGWFVEGQGVASIQNTMQFGLRAVELKSATKGGTRSGKLPALPEEPPRLL